MRSVHSSTAASVLPLSLPSSADSSSDVLSSTNICYDPCPTPPPTTTAASQHSLEVSRSQLRVVALPVGEPFTVWHIARTTPLQLSLATAQPTAPTYCNDCSSQQAVHSNQPAASQRRAGEAEKSPSRRHAHRLLHTTIPSHSLSLYITCACRHRALLWLASHFVPTAQS